MLHLLIRCFWNGCLFKQIKVTHHGGLVLGLQPAGGVDVSQGGAHAVRVAGVVYGGVVVQAGQNVSGYYERADRT